MSESAVLSHIDKRGVATITLNRPEKHNAFDNAIIAELIQTLTELEADESVRVLVLSANGKSFSAGADLGWMKSMAELDYQGNLEDARELAELMRKLNSFPKPAVARVQGATFGGAVGLVACCDMAIASTRASFSLSEVKIGLIPAVISPYVVAAMGARYARRYAISGEQFDAKIAAQTGLVSEVVSEDQLDEAMNEMVGALLGNSPQAMSEAKTLVAHVADQPINKQLIEYTCEAISNIRVSEEGQEGLSAFLQKREPKWLKEQNKEHSKEWKDKQ